MCSAPSAALLPFSISRLFTGLYKWWATDLTAPTIALHSSWLLPIKRNERDGNKWADCLRFFTIILPSKKENIMYVDDGIIARGRRDGGEIEVQAGPVASASGFSLLYCRRHNCARFDLFLRDRKRRCATTSCFDLQIWKHAQKKRAAANRNQKSNSFLSWRERTALIRDRRSYNSRKRNNICRPR